MTKAVLIHEDVGNIEEIELDIAPQKNEIFKLLEGRQTFIGQWPEIDVVIMKPEDGKMKNENILPNPPTSVIRIAKAPVIGPGPKARASIIVKINASTPRMKSKIRRIKKRKDINGVKFFAAKKASGSAIIAPPNVPTKAIKIVSPMAHATSLCRHIRLFQKSSKILAASPAKLRLTSSLKGRP